jgi:hypothetical protein
MYLTVKEAIDASNKSQTTIHRLCQKYENTKFVKKEGNKYLIDKEFLMEKYPEGSLDDEFDNISELGNNEGLIRSLTEKNELITSLTIRNKELESKIEELEEEIFEHHHELAKIIDANLGLNKEMKAMARPKTEIKPVISPTTENSTKELILKTLTITGSLILLVAFIFMMIEFTK